MWKSDWLDVGGVWNGNRHARTALFLSCDMHNHCPTHSFSFARTRSLTHSHLLVHTHSHLLPHTHSFSLAFTHSFSLPHTYSSLLPLKFTHTQSTFSLSLIHTHLYPVTVCTSLLVLVWNCRWSASSGFLNCPCASARAAVHWTVWRDSLYAASVK